MDILQTHKLVSLDEILGANDHIFVDTSATRYSGPCDLKQYLNSYVEQEDRGSPFDLQIVLNNLRITIPDGLVGEVAENNVVEVTYLRDPLKATIYLRQMDYEPAHNICDMSLGTVEMSSCKISGKECIKVRFSRCF